MERKSKIVLYTIIIIAVIMVALAFYVHIIVFSPLIFILLILLLLSRIYVKNLDVIYRPPDIYTQSNIEEYIQNNNLQKNYENKNIIIYLEDYDKGKFIRCIDKHNDNFFTVTGSQEIISTLWAVVEKFAQYNEYRYKGLKWWFSKRQQDEQLILTETLKSKK